MMNKIISEFIINWDIGMEEIVNKLWTVKQKLQSIYVNVEELERKRKRKVRSDMRNSYWSCLVGSAATLANNSLQELAVRIGY